MNDAGLAPDPDRPRISPTALLFLALLLIAAGLTRFWALGDRPLHHDESIHAYQSWTLSRGGDWRYDPAYHGPFLYYANALVYRVFGASDFTARLLPAVFGLLLIGFAWPLKRWIGGAAAVYAVLVLASAHFAYFSRFIREDVYSLVFTLGTILAFQRFLETDRAKWLTLSAVLFAFAGVTKENAYMTGVLFVAYGIWRLLERAASAKPYIRSFARAVQDTAGWTRRHLFPVFSAGIVFLVIWVTMYTAFLRYPGDWWAINKAVKYWMGQHAIARIPGPWYYYFPQILYYDTAILLASAFAFPWREWRRDPLLRAVLVLSPIVLGAAYVRAVAPGMATLPGLAAIALGAVAVGIVLFLRRSPEPPEATPFVRFVAFWAIGSLVLYGWAREKVPWLTVHPLLPLTIVASLGVTRLWRERGRPWARVALGAIALLFAINTGGMYLACFRYGAHDVEREPHHAEMIAYVQTTRDLVRALSSVGQARARIAPGQSVITVAGEAAWPLTWYLRDVPTTWTQRIEQASTPIIVADWDAEGALEKQLAGRYDAKRVPIRAWWFPETKKGAEGTRPSFMDALRWWLFHEIWSPIGSQDATFFVRKDLGGTGMLEPLQLQVQDTSSRDYPVDGTELPAPRIVGGPGSGPGQFSEPRGLAADSRGNIYVADTKNSRVEVFDAGGAFLRALGSRGPGDGQLNEPCGVAVGPDGEIYVADTWNHRVARFKSGGEPDGAWVDPEKGFFGPRSVVLSQGSVYVADTGNKRVVRFDAAGNVTARWGGAGSGPGQFIEPVGLAADSSGRLYVADTGNHRVQVFDADGNFLRQFPVYGWKDFYTEPYLSIGPGDSVLLTDSWKGRIALYGASGTLTRSFKAEGLKRPTGIALDPFGHVTVSDRDASRLLVWPLDAFR